MVAHAYTVPVTQVVSELTRLNRGSAPRSFEECCNVAASLNWRILILPPCECPVAHANTRQHVIYLPQGTDRELFQAALHELSEVITRKEGGEPEFQACDDTAHHAVADSLLDYLLPWFAQERERLEQQKANEERILVALKREMQANAEHLQQFAAALSEGRDLYGLIVPDRSNLVSLQRKSQHHTDRLSMIQARLRCI